MRFARCLAAGSAGIIVVPLGADAQALTRPQFAGKLFPCELQSAPSYSAYCGRRTVFEDRAAGRGRTIDLNIVVLPATTDSVASDAVVFLAGGGVIPATRYARFLAQFTELRKHRDIVLVDQRGTGDSHALVCDRATLDTAATGMPPDERYLRYVAACRVSLRDRADVRLYTTSNAMEDLDDVRAWLGYGSLNLYAASYGTSAAQIYVKLHPDRVRTVVMHGVVPVDVPMQVDLARSAQQSLDRVLDACVNDAACRAAFPDIRGDFATVLRQNPGQPFREALNGALAGLAGIRNVPLMIHEAATGTPPPPDSPPPGPAPAPLGVRLSILCSEGLASIDTATISTATRGTFLGDFPVRFQLRWCHGWPTAPLPPGFRTPVRSSTPALLLTGALDPITSPSYADRVGAWFAGSTVLELPNKSHSDTDPCVTRMIERFIVSGGAKPDVSCLAATPSIRFSTQR